MTRTRPAPAEFVTCPFTILVDGREKAPYRFQGIRADASQQRRPLVITTEWQHLATGDYTISGLEHLVAIERKSLADLYSTLGQNRERFEREHERMAAIVANGGYCCVVVESDWEAAIHWPPKRSRLPPKVVFRTALSWGLRYRVPWHFLPDRRFAEIYTFRVLEKFWKHYQKVQKELKSNGETIGDDNGRSGSLPDRRRASR